MGIYTNIIGKEKKISKEKKCGEFPGFFVTHSLTRSQSVAGTQASGSGEYQSPVGELAPCPGAYGGSSYQP